jgi:hypothetical protein
LLLAYLTNGYDRRNSISPPILLGPPRFFGVVMIGMKKKVGVSLDNTDRSVDGDGLVVPSWLALCWIALGSGFVSQCGHLFFGISPREEISQEGFIQGLVSPPATSRWPVIPRPRLCVRMDAGIY